MATITKKKKSTKKLAVSASQHIRTMFRFSDATHHSLVKSAADKLGLSMNSWLIQATLKQARKDLDS
jgi:predicted HicB family RNase H-like nuclease